MGPYLPAMIVVSYVAVLLAIGFWAARLAKQGKEGFFLAGRRGREKHVPKGGEEDAEKGDKGGKQKRR